MAPNPCHSGATPGFTGRQRRVGTDGLPSEPFAVIRDAVLALDEADRRRLADLCGAMQEPRPPLSEPAVAVLAAFVALDAADRAKLGKWFGQYVNRWGQIPQASGRKASAAALSRNREPKP